MDNIFKRFTCLFLALLMILEVFSPVTALAAEGGGLFEEANPVDSTNNVEKKISDELFNEPAEKTSQKDTRKTTLNKKKEVHKNSSNKPKETGKAPELIPAKKTKNDYEFFENTRKDEAKAEEKAKAEAEAKAAEEAKAKEEQAAKENAELEKQKQELLRIEAEKQAAAARANEAEAAAAEAEYRDARQKRIELEKLLEEKLKEKGLRDQKKQESEKSLNEEKSNKLEDKKLEEVAEEEEEKGLLEKIKEGLGLTDLQRADKELKKALKDKDKGLEEIQALLDTFEDKYDLSREDQEKLMADNEEAFQELIARDREENFRPSMLAVKELTEDEKTKLNEKKFNIITRFDTSTRNGSIQAGQYFNIYLDKQLKVNNSSELEPIYNGNTKIAEPTYDINTNTIKYKILNDINEDLQIPLDIPVDYNTQNITLDENGEFVVVNRVSGLGITDPKDLVPQKVDKNGNLVSSIIEPGRKDVIKIIEPDDSNYKVDTDAYSTPVIKDGKLQGYNWTIKVSSDTDLNELGLKVNFTEVVGSGLKKIENSNVDLEDQLEGAFGIHDSKHHAPAAGTKEITYNFYTGVQGMQENYMMDISIILTEKGKVGAKRFVMDGWPADKVIEATPIRSGMNNRTTILGEFRSETEARWTVTDAVSTGDDKGTDEKPADTKLPWETRSLSDNQTLNENDGKIAVYKIDLKTGKMDQDGATEVVSEIPGKGTNPSTNQPVGTIAVYQYDTSFNETEKNPLSLAGVMMSKYKDIYVDQNWNLDEGISMPAQTLKAVDPNNTEKELGSTTVDEETPVEQSEVIIPVVNFEDDGQETSPIQGNSTIIVENLDENNKPVVGAKYQISDANTKEALWTKTSDERGIAQFVELDPGEYILEEIFTPEGYDSAGYFVEITVDENKNTTYKAIKTEADQVVELEAEVYEEEIEKEKSQVRQEVQIEKKKQEEIMEKLEVNIGDILSEIMKPSPELPDFSKELDIFNFNKENLIEIEEPDHKENGKLVNSVLTAIVEGLLGKPQVARAIEAELPKEETVIEENTTEPATEETETTVEDADTKLEPQTEPVEETTTEEASTELEISQPTYISMFSARSSINNIETANLNSNYKVDFIKVDEDNKALAGADFELRQKIGGKYSSLSPKVTATSDENGYFSFENISLGDYGVFEITPPKGYPTPIAEVAHITVNDDGSISGIHNERDEKSQRYKVVNVKGTAEFSFTKVDESGKPLEGVEFALSGYSAQNGSPTRLTATSGTDGIISFTELPLDSYYYLRETKTVQGYAIANNLWIVRIIKATTDDTAEIQQKGYKVELYNTGSLTPAGSYGPHPTIDGAWAKMNADKTKYVNVKTGAEQELDTVTGATIKPQDLNTYKSWPDLKVATQPLEITNKKADLLVYKHDEDGKPLDGAEFTLTLTDGTGSSIVKSSINGEVAYTDLADGTYELTETKAPLGYDGTKDKWIVTVSNGEITVKKDGPDSGGGTTPVVGSPIEYFDGNGIIGTTYSKSHPYYYTNLNIGTKIISADRDKGTFEALVYVNNISAKAHRNSNILIEGINPETSHGSSVKTLSSAEIYKVSNNYISTAMPRDFNIDLSQSYYTKVVSAPPNTDKDISINLEGNTAYYNAYVVKITGTYDKDSTSPISLKSTFNGYVYWNGYYYDSTAFVYNYVSPSPWSPSDPDSPTEPTTDDSIGIGPDGQPTVTVTNTKRDPKGKVKIYKTGNDGKPLENVMFELKGPVIDGDSNPRTETVLTDANGEYLFENLQEGEYFLTELQTTEGYLKTTQIWKIVVDKDGNTKILSGDSSNVTVENPTPTTPTDSNTTSPIYKGKLNETTQISSPSETQKETYYPSYKNPIVYTSEIDGEYAEDFDQTEESLRNPWLKSSLGNYGGYLTYQGNYQTTFNKDWHTMDFAKVAKYAEKTSPAVNDHNYDITLKVTGNTYPEKERDKLGVIILYDNSNSMNERVGSTGKTRTTLAKEATTDFVNTLSSQNPDTEFALVTYGSSVFDGKNHTIKFQGIQYTATTPDNSYLEFTSSPTDITNKLPSITPMEYTGKFVNFGGTFTGGAFLEAQKLVEQAKERTTNKFDRLVIVNVTDGVPTLSPIVESTSKNEEGEIVTTFTQVNDTSGTAPNVKGDGEYYYLNGYKFSYNNPYSYYDSTTNKYNTVDNHGFPTVQLSQNVKNLDTEVFNIGIAVTGDAAVANTTAKTLMADISSGAGYNYDLTDADKLPDAFNSIINSVYRDTISKGIVTDPMGEKVDLVVDGTFDLNDYTISATRNGVEAPDLLNGVTPKYDPTTRTITLEGLNLGLGEEVVFKYKVALRVDDETVSDNVYYFTNGETTLQPNPTAGKVLWNFPVPSVKKIGEEPPQEVPKLSITNFKKPSVEFFKTTVIGTPLAGAKFQLYKKTKDVNGNATRMPVGEEVTVGEDGRIYFENLDVGNYELVETQAPVGYKKLEDPAVTFEVTDKGEVTNISGKELDTSTGNNNIWNWRLPEMEVELKKLDGELNAISKGNVEFKLTKASNNTSGGDVPSHLQTLSFADLSALQKDGQSLKFKIPSEMDGEYILEETKAPDGYMRSFDKYHIMISQADRTIKLVKLTNALGIEKTYRHIGADGKEVSVKLSEKPIILYSESSQGVKDEAVSLDFGVVNTEAVYPSTGGIGTLAFTIIGCAIMGGTLIKSRRKKEEEEEDRE